LVTRINGLDERPDIREVVGFPYAGDLVLDSSGKSIVELLSECGVTPLDLSCKMVEFDEVLGDMLVVMHVEVLDLCFGLPFGVVRSEVGSEFRDEFIIVVKPVRC